MIYSRAVAARILKPSLLRRCYATTEGLREAPDASDTAVKPYSAVPGPKGWPVLGNALELRKNMGSLAEYFSEGFKKYGDIFKVEAFGSRLVLFRDPNKIEDILRAEGKYPTRDIATPAGMQWLAKNAGLEVGVVFLAGEAWKSRRTAMGKKATPKCVHSYTDAFNTIFNNFMEYIRSSRGEDGTIDNLVEPLKLLMVEISTKFTFDSNIEVVKNPSGEHKEFVDAITTLLEVIARIRTELPIYKLYNSDIIRKHDAGFKVINGIARKEMEKVYARLESGEESATPGLLEQWLREGKLTEEEAICEAGIVFAAGVDTTANQSAFLLHLMARHPEVQERLYEEVRSVMGESKYPSPQQLAQMPYMKGCILESFRLASTVPFFGRLAAEGSVVHGYSIPAKTTIVYCSHVAGRDEKLFPDPLKFDPERWKRDDKHAFAVLPFGFGPRGCYGRRFAELELKLLLVQMVLNFKLNTTLVDLKKVQRGILAPAGDLPVTFTDRTNTAEQAPEEKIAHREKGLQ